MPRNPATHHLVLYQDDHLLVACKPAGTPVHGSKMFEDRPRTLIRLLREETGQVLHPVHRLDRAVSGLVLFALDTQTLATLGKQFEHRQTEKRYLAIVRGWMAEKGNIDYPLAAPKDERVSNNPPREAVTSWKTLAQTEIDAEIPPYQTARYSLLELCPLTGRRHQLRRHAKHISHPIIGDTSYGRGEHNRLFRERFDCHRLLLHAWKLAFLHPEDGNRVEFCAAPDGEFSRTISKLGWTV